MANRKHIARATEAAVLLNSARRCCLCFLLEQDFAEKDGQIAHLDRNPANGSEDNLAFLCLGHHANYDSQTSQHKNYTINEVKVARTKLYERVAEWKPCQWFLILDGMYSEDDKLLIETHVEHLRELLGDPHLTIKRIDPGSIRLLVESSTDAYRQMQNLFETGRIRQILGYPIDAVERIPEDLLGRIPADVRAIREKLGTLASDNEIAHLAYSYWETRGRPAGSPESDWVRAEEEIRSRAVRAYVNGFIDAFFGRRSRDAHSHYLRERDSTEAAGYREGWLEGQRQRDQERTDTGG